MSLIKWPYTHTRCMHIVSCQRLPVPAGKPKHQVSHWSRRDESQTCPWGGSYVSTLARWDKPVSGSGLLMWAELQTCTPLALHERFKCLEMGRGGRGGEIFTLLPSVVWHEGIILEHINPFQKRTTVYRAPYRTWKNQRVKPMLWTVSHFKRPLCKGRGPLLLYVV